VGDKIELEDVMIDKFKGMIENADEWEMKHFELSSRLRSDKTV